MARSPRRRRVRRFSMLGAALAALGALALAFLGGGRPDAAAAPQPAASPARAAKRSPSAARTSSPSPDAPTGLEAYQAIEDEPPPEPVTTGVASCDAFITRYLACPALPARTKLEMAPIFAAWRDAAAAIGGTVDDLATTCAQASAAQDEMMATMGC